MPSIKDIVAGQSVGVGKRVIKAGADKLRGMINDRTGGGMPSYNDFKVTSLTYPLDVKDDPRQGHYIVFTVRSKTKEAVVDDSGSIDKTNIVAVESSLTQKSNSFGKGVLKGIMGTAGHEHGTFDKSKIMTFTNLVPGGPTRKITAEKIAEQKIQYYSAGEAVDAKDLARGHSESADGRQGKARFSLRAPSYRTSTIITLYMPPQVKNITGVTYKDQELGMMDVAVGSIISAFASSSSGGRSLDNVETDNIKTKAVLRKLGESVGIDSDELYTLDTGHLVSARMEFVFEAVKKRVFTYQFSFYPKSEKEAMEIELIIRTFRRNMLPARAGDEQDILSLKVPNEFNIEYYYKTAENNFINKVGTCLLTDCDITYGGDKYGTFKQSKTKEGDPGASPTETHMTVTFQEMDIITQEDVDTGF
jgi:hypothetical protein